MGRLRMAYRYGGAAGVRACAYPVDPDPDLLDEAADEINGQRPAPAALEIDRNRITDHAAGVQIRLGPDQRWYPFTGERDIWTPARHPDPSPANAFNAALEARRARKRH
jgi:hypothetical protein